MTYPGPEPNSLTSERDQRREYDAKHAEQRERFGEGVPGPMIYGRHELRVSIGVLRQMLRRYYPDATVFDGEQLASVDAVLCQAAQMLERDDEEIWRLKTK